jgi:hypothetical protein
MGQVTVAFSDDSLRNNVRKKDNLVGNDAPKRRRRITSDAGRSLACGGGAKSFMQAQTRQHKNDANSRP